MCGIMGYYAFGEKRPKHKVLTEMFYLLEARGHDACGWAWQDKEGKLQLFKIAQRSSEIIQTPYWKFPPLAKSMIFHTRAATQGTVKDSRNNHPLLGKEGKRVLVHNGIINNEHRFGITTDKVDSLAILRALESEDDPVVGLNKLQGSFAIAVLHSENQDLILARHYSPIEIIYDKVDDILYFASELRMLTGPLQVKSKVLRGIEFNSDRYYEVDFPDDTMWIVNQKGLKSVHKLSPLAYTSYGYPSQRWSGHYYGDDFSPEYGRRGKREPKKLTDGKEIWNFNCPYCDSRFDYDSSFYSQKCPKCQGIIYKDDIASYFENKENN